MKLKERFFNVIFEYAWKFKTEKIVPACVKIADNYACDFAYWLSNDWLLDERWSKITEPKELLEIFKIEKGL